MLERTKWFEYSPGVTSALRIGFMVGIMSGVVGLIYTMVYGIIIIITKSWEAVPFAVAMAAACGGIIAVSDVAKGIQAHAEEKNSCKEEKKE